MVLFCVKVYAIFDVVDLAFCLSDYSDAVTITLKQHKMYYHTVMTHMQFLAARSR